MKYAYKTRLAISFVVLIFAIAGAIGLFYPVKIFDIQLVPVLQRVFVDFSLTCAVILGAIIILTLLFGRFYCSLICPLGILQEFFALIIKRKNKYCPNFPFKYFLAAIVFGVMIYAGAFLIKYFDPYTYFVNGFSASLFGLVAIFAVFTIVFFKNRFFCSNICPAGAVLGLLSKISLNKIYIDEKNCVSCMMCEKNCPTGCINSKEKKIENTTCIKCLKCLEICKKDGIKFGIKQNFINFSPKRRDILYSIAALGLLGTMIKTGAVIKDKVYKYKNVILPSGAGSEEEFLNKCLNCNLCSKNCPAKIIVKANNEFGAPHIDYTKGYCEKNCNKCAEICPAGAIKRFDIEKKQKIRIAIAAIEKDKCAKCGICVYNCPYDAIQKQNENTPYIDASKCIGCAKCKHVCKADAINIYAVKKQTLI